MKRQLLHPSCLVLGTKHGNYSAIEAAEMSHEQTHRVHGLARSAYICDQCGGEIASGAQVVAETICGYGQVYHPWETDYIAQPVEEASGTGGE